MKLRLSIALLAGIVIGAFAYRTWDLRTATARHWQAVREYNAYMRDPANYVPAGNGLAGASEPFDPMPHLAALVSVGELIHADIVFPSVPYPNRVVTRHWMKFCEQHPEEIVYAYGHCNPGPIHLNFWCTEAGQPLIDQLIEELQGMGPRGEPIASPNGQRPAPAPAFDVPSGVTYELDARAMVHSFRWGTKDTTALFMMYPHPAGLNHAMVGEMARDAKRELESAMRKIKGVLDVETTVDDLSAGDYTGKAIVCKLHMEDGKAGYQTIHILWDGSRLWQGQLTATTEDDLRMVETLLKSRIQEARTKP